ncbi:MAG: hypothetical protein Q8S33_02175 [Myxococcales bacterium]|nr:hypothetical protein [Myxococcales bacterium]
MHRLALLSLLLVALTARAQGVTESLDAGLPAVPRSTIALYASTATVVAIATAALSTFAGSLLPMAVFDAQGRPDPLALAGGFAIASILNAAVLHLTLPFLTGVGATDGAASSTTTAQEKGWRASRWALVGAAVGLLTMTGGALAERDRFATGQWAMLLGAGTAIISMVAFDVLEAVFAWQGFVASRRLEHP